MALSVDHTVYYYHKPVVVCHFVVERGRLLYLCALYSYVYSSIIRPHLHIGLHREGHRQRDCFCGEKQVHYGHTLASPMEKRELSLL